MRISWIALIVGIGIPARAGEPLVLRPGFVTKLPCEGKLYLSSIGNPSLVELQALPKELGCAVILKPLSIQGTTNLILETSGGTIEREVLIQGARAGSPEKKR